MLLDEAADHVLVTICAETVSFLNCIEEALLQDARKRRSRPIILMVCTNDALAACSSSSPSFSLLWLSLVSACS